MSELNKIRLNKVLREFNISLERVVEFLSSKGHNIEARPTTKISQIQYDLLLNEFSSDRSSKVESDDLSEEKKKEKEVILAKAEQEKELKIQRKVITSKSSIQQFKKVGEIDLDKPVSVTIFSALEPLRARSIAFVIVSWPDIPSAILVISDLKSLNKFS